MSTTMYVVPENAGSQLEHPVSGVLPDSGAFWLADTFTFRLIQERAIAPGTAPGEKPSLMEAVTAAKSKKAGE